MIGWEFYCIRREVATTIYHGYTIFMLKTEKRSVAIIIADDSVDMVASNFDSSKACSLAIAGVKDRRLYAILEN